MGWSDAITQPISPDAVSLNLRVEGPGPLKNFLGRHSYSIMGGMFADWLHDQVVGTDSDFLSDAIGKYGEEAVSVVASIVVAYMIESFLARAGLSMESKLFTAGMSGWQGTEAWHVVKSLPGTILSKKKREAPAQGGVVDLNMDKNPDLFRDVVAALKNSPKKVRLITDRLAETLADQPAEVLKDKDKLAEQLRAEIAELTQQLG